MTNEDKNNIVEYWQEYFSRSAFRTQLGIKIDSLDEKGATVHIEIDPKFHTQTANIVHGGVVATLIDSSIATAARWFIEKGQRTVTADLNIHYLSPAKEKLIARAEISHVGRSSILGTCEVFSGEKKVAFGSASYRILSQV